MAEKYFSIKSEEIKQFNSDNTRFGKMNFEDLIGIVRFSNRESNPFNPQEQKEDSSKFAEKNFFQRTWSESRLNEISRFIEKELSKNGEKEGIPLFPTPIIISLERDMEVEEEINEKGLEKVKLEWDKQNSCFLIKENIIIPNAKNLALIVDGQHRLKGIQKYIEKTGDKKINKMELPVIFLIGLDLFGLGKTFANINFEQKNVNKSIYYDIFGALPSQLSIEKLCHEIVLNLNNDSQSPLFNQINLLGRGKGFVSQAQIIDLIIKYFKDNGIWNKYYRDFVLGGLTYEKISLFLRIYFQEVKNRWNSCYPKENEKKSNYGYILLKTTGIGALLRLIKEIFVRVENLNENEMRKEISKYISKIDNQEAEKLFIKSGEFGSSGSYGLQSKLAKRLRKLIFNIDEKKGL